MLELNRVTTLIVSATVVVLLSLLDSFRDKLYSLELDQFSGPRVSSTDGKTYGGAEGGSAGSCRMAWMNPSFQKLNLVESNRLAKRYSAYLYRDTGWDPDQVIKNNQSPVSFGSPVLFIPGNAGSFRQVRSIASASSSNYFESPRKHPRSKYQRRSHPGLDFYTIDFNQDFSAFSGETLTNQAEFGNHVISSILSIYRHQSQSQIRSHGLPAPRSVLIIGHSMGGIVARRMMTMANYIDGSINTIISMSSPHLMPPITFDNQMEMIYRDLNNFWRRSYWDSDLSQSPLRDVVLVVISGGASDTTISSDAASLLSLAPPSHSLSFFTTAIPGVWTSVDHLAILWCDQLRQVLAKTLLDLTDPRLPRQVGEVEERMEILRSHLVNGHGISPFDSERSSDRFHTSDSSGSDSYNIYPSLSPLRLSRSDLDDGPVPRIHVIPLIPHHSQQKTVSGALQFTLLSNLIANDRLHVLLCNGSYPKDFLESCHSVSASSNYSYLVPESRFDLSSAAKHSDGHPGQTPILSYITCPDSDLWKYNYMVIQTLPISDVSTSESGFLIAEFRDVKNTSTSLSDSLWSLALWGTELDKFPSRSSMVSEIRLEKIDSSLLAFRLELERAQGCDREGDFAPMMQQISGLQLEESKFHPNVRSAIVSNHFSRAYSPILRKTRVGYGGGVLLRFWHDPKYCGDGSSLRIRVKLDLKQTCQKVLLRFRTAFVSIPVSLSSLVLMVQLQNSSNLNRIDSFGKGLSIITNRYLMKILILIGLVQSIQSILLNPSMFLSTTESEGQGVGSQDGFKELYEPSVWVSNLLLGDHHFMFYLLECLMVLIGIGWTGIIYLFIEVVLRGLSSLRMFNLVFKISKPTAGVKSTRSNKSEKIMYSVLGLIVLLTLTCIVPRDILYLTVVLFQLLITLKAYIKKTCQEPKLFNREEYENRYNFLVTNLLITINLIPISLTKVMVWLRDLQETRSLNFEEVLQNFRNLKGIRGAIGVLGYLIWMIWCDRELRFRTFKKDLDGDDRYVELGGLRGGRRLNEIFSLQNKTLSNEKRKPNQSDLFSLNRDSKRVNTKFLILKHTLMVMSLFNLIYGIRLTYKVFENLNYFYLILFLFIKHLQ
ncbi:PGAP1-like protein-domain-containing protein [Phakopsora pachyrhizi]|uniref:GPI inositol-deacylase n=1 Tax=Phakopsora pachyrhizi TaxID=170000 RepID=A0AAV0ARP5_PHAPC|nr:PGAP1-like protein-domain-containing protein [Phakopsora pachyrhizi]